MPPLASVANLHAGRLPRFWVCGSGASFSKRSAPVAKYSARYEQRLPFDVGVSFFILPLKAVYGQA